jgi:hypothetical protein
MHAGRMTHAMVWPKFHKLYFSILHKIRIFCFALKILRLNVLVMPTLPSFIISVFLDQSCVRDESKIT